MLKALADPAHERRTEMLDWLGTEFDPNVPVATPTLSTSTCSRSPSAGRSPLGRKCRCRTPTPKAYDAEGIRIDYHCNGRSAAQSRPAPPIVRCSPGAPAPNSPEVFALSWMSEGAHSSCIMTAKIGIHKTGRDPISADISWVTLIYMKDKNWSLQTHAPGAGS